MKDIETKTARFGRIGKLQADKNSAWWCKLCKSKKHHTLASHRLHMKRVHGVDE